MSEFKPITFSDEFILKYWDGAGNRIVRYQNYLQRGLMLFNEGKNYIFILFGLFWTTKATDWWLERNISDTWLILGLGILAVIGFIGLILVGRWHLFKASKATEVLNARHASITGYQSFNMTVKMVELQEEILKELKKITKPPESGVEIAIKKL